MKIGNPIMKIASYKFSNSCLWFIGPSPTHLSADEVDTHIFGAWCLEIYEKNNCIER